MGSYNEGSKFKNVPVLKFMDYDRVVVLLDGRPEEATIEGSTNNYAGGEIYHITAPSGTVADIEVVGKDAYIENQIKSAPQLYDDFGYPIDQSPNYYRDAFDKNSKRSNRSNKRLIAKNIHIQ